jgi:hypothetical protein
VDINGAKALKERLGEKAVEEAAPPARADVHQDAPPVYRWTGVSKPACEMPAGGREEPASGASLFRRLTFSFR